MTQARTHASLRPAAARTTSIDPGMSSTEENILETTAGLTAPSSRRDTYARPVGVGAGEADTARATQELTMCAG
jgi:hypothetical protein